MPNEQVGYAEPFEAEVIGKVMLAPLSVEDYEFVHNLEQEAIKEKRDASIDLMRELVSRSVVTDDGKELRFKSPAEVQKIPFVAAITIAREVQKRNRLGESAEGNGPQLGDSLPTPSAD